MMKDQEQKLLDLLLEREYRRVSGAKTYTAEEMRSDAEAVLRES